MNKWPLVSSVFQNNTCTVVMNSSHVTVFPTIFDEDFLFETKLV